MAVLVAVLAAVAVALLVLGILDLARKVPLITAPLLALYLPPALNAPLAAYLVANEVGQSWWWLLVVVGVLFLYVWLRLNVLPVADGVPVGLRLRVLSGTPPILWALCYAVVVQVLVLPLSFLLPRTQAPLEVLLTNIGYSLGCCLVLYLNAAIRALVSSHGLGLSGRLLILAAPWLPIVGWVLCVFVARSVRREYLAGVDRVEWELATPRDDRCATKYPIILVHGVGWRDHTLYNAWGRIPKYLKRHGAWVYHGEQQAWGTIEQNAQQIADQVQVVLDLTHADKVNLIAHSRGGIDARYALSQLGIADRVASLTTMNSPHHGVRFADTATKLKQPVYEVLAAVVNFIFRLSGDEKPDFLASTMAFRTERAREFNEANPDAPGVHYQSYTSVMGSASSDRLLAVPYGIIKALGEDNDGLVSIESAKWGEFRGVFRSTTSRGVSHGDLVDMNREDYAGFNVLDTYLTIVSDLKQRGF